MRDEFGGALGGADEAVVTEIYPAREHPVEGVTAKLVVEALTRIARGCRSPTSRSSRTRRVPAHPGGRG